MIQSPPILRNGTDHCPSQKILAVSGGLASGKSLMAHQLSVSMGWLWVSFGQYVREIASSRNMPHTNKNLQALGQELIAGGPDKFCQDVLDHFEWTPHYAAVVDGVRHAEILESLRRITSPLPVLSIFVYVPDEIREQRIQTSGGITKAEVLQMQNHSTEIQLPNLANSADYRVDGTQEPHLMLEQVLTFLNGTSKSNRF